MSLLSLFSPHAYLWSLAEKEGNAAKVEMKALVISQKRQTDILNAWRSQHLPFALQGVRSETSPGKRPVCSSPRSLDVVSHGLGAVCLGQEDRGRGRLPGQTRNLEPGCGRAGDSTRLPLLPVHVLSCFPRENPVVGGEKSPAPRVFLASATA